MARTCASCICGMGRTVPVVGAPAATLVIGPVFVHGIASRTLAGLAAPARSAELVIGCWQDVSIPEERTYVAERRRVAVTGIGAVTPIGIGARGAVERAAARAVGRRDAHAIRSVDVAQPQRGAGERLRRRGLHGAQEGEAPRPLRRLLRRVREAGDRGRGHRPRRRGSRARRRDDGQRARRHSLRRGAARRLPPRGHQVAVDPALALERLRRRVELQHRHRAWRAGAEQHATR